MDSKKKTILSLGLVLIAVLIAVIILQLQERDAPLNTETKINNPFLPSGQENLTPQDWQATEVRKPVPVGTVVPEIDTEMPAGLKDKIAVPEATAPVNPTSGSDAQIRTYTVRAEANKFIPEKIIVNQGDIVHIDFTAVDKDYDFVLGGYNMKQNVKAGGTASLEFQALKDGDFIYYCNTCGGLEAGPQGHIIVVK